MLAEREVAFSVVKIIRTAEDSRLAVPLKRSIEWKNLSSRSDQRWPATLAVLAVQVRSEL